MERLNFNYGTGMTSNKVVQVLDSMNEAEFNKNTHVLNSVAQELVKDYQWNEKIAKIASNLIFYFNGLKHQYDLDKSIALCGTYGVGKTKLMRIFQEYMRRKVGGYGHPNIYRIISIEEVIKYMSEPNAIDSEILYNYHIKLDRPVRKPANLMINEFGYSYNGKNFGTEYKELVEMFIMNRYDIFQEHGKLTHVTMNYGPKELEKVFDKKITDRFKEMFNIIPLDGESFRK
jgi:DNA replication protein DnaC